MTEVRAEVQLVRETLEGIVEPSVATSILFESLSRWGTGIPSGPTEVLELVRGPLRQMLEQRLGSEAGPALAGLEAQLLALSPSASPAAEPESYEELVVEIEIDAEEPDESDVLTAQMVAVERPVVVLVVAGYREFAQRLTAALGLDRVHALTVSDVPELRHTVFSASPEIVLVDAAQPAPVHAPELAKALTSLPDATISFVWGEETRYGRELRAHLDELGSRTLFLARTEGIEPLLDLVLSRFKRPTIPPPRL